MLKIHKMRFLSLVLMVLLTGCAATKSLLNKAPAAATKAPADTSTVVATTPVPSATTSATSASDTAESATNPKTDLREQRVFYFDYDQDTLKPESYSALKAHAQYLANKASAHVRLEGHGDERGTREYNLALGERRANAIAQFLTLNSVTSEQIETVSYGEEKPVSLEHDESAWAHNRRVELIYTTQ